MIDLETTPRVDSQPALNTPEPEPRSEPAPWRMSSPAEASAPLRLLARVLGIGAALGGCALAINLDGGFVGPLVQVVPFLIVMSMAWFGLVASHGPVLVGRFLAMLAGSLAVDEIEADALRAMARRGRRLCHVGGLLAALIGVIHILSVLDQPALIGPGAAVALVGPLHALLIGELGFGAAENWVRVARAPA